MTETAVENEQTQQVVQAPSSAVSDEQLVAMLVDRARNEGLHLTGEGGLLQLLTKRVLESALEGEITDHVGYEKHDPAGKNNGNSRNGTRAKTVLTDVGPVEVRVPRDTAGTFEPQIVKKRQRRLTGVDEMVLSLSAKGLTHGEISAHLAEVYGAEVSKQTISTITDKVMDGMAEWQNRPLDRVYPVLFVDAINVKIRDGQSGDRLASHSCPDVCGSPAAELVPIRGPAGLGQGRQGPQAHLHRTQRGRGHGAVPGVPGVLGRQIPGDREAVVGRMGRVRALPLVRRRDTQGHLLDERDRERECPHPQGRPSSRPLPQRGCRPQVRLHGAHEPGPDGEGAQEVDHALEGTPERVPDRLRGPPHPEQQLTLNKQDQPLN